MKTFTYDIVLLTQGKYVNPIETDWYVDQILTEDRLLQEALESLGFVVGRTNWDNPAFDWTSTRFVLFRGIWDYFNRFDEFMIWLEHTSRLCGMINAYETVCKNADKHYLMELSDHGITIPSTLFIEPGDQRSLSEICSMLEWKEFIVKPAVSGAGRHTYRINRASIKQHEAIFKTLIQSESMLIQEFQHSITTKGEITLVLFGGKYSHAVIKKAKSGEFRVQDDFGGSVQAYVPTDDEIHFAEKVMSKVCPTPVYGRVDAIWDNDGRLCVSELELIEPELWFRLDELSAPRLAHVIFSQIGLVDQR